MKKKLFLLPIALLLLGGCSAAEGEGNTSGSGPNIPVSVEDAVRIMKETTEYKAQYSLEMSGHNAFTMLGPAIPCDLTRHISGLARLKGNSSSQEADDQSMKIEYTMKISDMVQKTGMSLGQLLNILESYSDYIEDYVVDEANDKFWFRMDGGSDFNQPHTTMYTTLKEGESQYCYAVYYNNRMIQSEYLEVGVYGSDEFLSMMQPIVAEIEKDVSKLEEKDGKYVLDLSETPLDVGYGTLVTSLGFSYNASSFTIDFSESIASDYIEEVKGSYLLYDLNHSELNMPEFEVFCPFNHACTYDEWINPGSHAKMCRYCNKIVGQPVAHSRDAKHNKCTVCEGQHVPHESTSFALKTKDGSAYLGGHKNGDKYYNVYVSNYGASFSDNNREFKDVERTGSLYYFHDDNIIVVQYGVGEGEPFGTCYHEFQVISYVFKNVTIELTPEQEAIIAEGTDMSAIREIYENALNLGDSIIELKAKYPDYDFYNSYDFISDHEEDLPVVIYTGTCCTSSYRMCTKCHQCTYAYVKHHHEYDLTVGEQPSWASGSGYDIYATAGTCAKCGQQLNELVRLEKNPYHEYSSYVTVYDSEGHSHDYFENLNYHIDHDDDNRCDICGAVKLSVTSQGVTYTIYVYGTNVVSGTVNWTPMGGHDPIDGDSAVSYQNCQNQLIYCNVAFHIDHEQHTIYYRMFVGDDVYQSSTYPYGV